MPLVFGGAECRRRQFAECKAIISGKMPRIKEAACKCGRDHRRSIVRLLKHASGVSQSDAFDEGHWGAIARISEGLEYAAGARTGRGRKCLHGDRTVPIGKDIFLNAANLPRCRRGLLTLQNFAEIVRVSSQEGYKQHLLELDERRSRHFFLVAVEFAYHEFEHASQSPERRVIKARPVGEFDVAGNWHSDNGAQLSLQGRGLDAKKELLKTGLIFVCHLDARRNNGRLVRVN